MKNNTVKTLGELELRELMDLGLRMPDGSTELFEVVNISDDCVTVIDMTSEKTHSFRGGMIASSNFALNYYSLIAKNSFSI